MTETSKPLDMHPEQKHALHSYGKVYNLGHAAVVDLLTFPIVIQEKVDGSQFSFGVHNGVLHVRSKDAVIDVEAPPKMFAGAVETVKAVRDKLVPGWTYRGEVLSKPKHNVLAYDRVPAGGVILFDVDGGLESYVQTHTVQTIGATLGLEVVPTLWEGDGVDFSYDQFKTLLETISVLGGQKIEGVVIKAYGRFGRDGKTLMGKYVSEAYKEIHAGEWRAQNPTRLDIVQEIARELTTPARWEKAIQHLRDRGVLQNAPQDIGPLLREVAEDTLAEVGEEIKARLFKHAWKDIQRMIVRGFPQWYKDKLAQAQFGRVEDQHGA